MVDQILFKFKEYVQLWQTGAHSLNTNNPMIQYNTKIYKGVTNTIEFVIRNNDRRPINLVGYQIEALIQRVEDPELLLTKCVTATDERAGKAELLLLDIDINNWLSGYYKYSIRLTDINGKQEYLYTDINRSTCGTFELIEGMSVALSPALEISGNKFSSLPASGMPSPYGVSSPYADYSNIWATGALKGDAQSNKASGMHTIVVYTNKRFFGKLWIQGSLSLMAPADTDWFNIPLTGETDFFVYHHKDSPKIKVFNFTGNYYWIRVFYKPDSNNKGHLEKILYKN